MGSVDITLRDTAKLDLHKLETKIHEMLRIFRHTWLQKCKLASISNEINTNVAYIITLNKQLYEWWRFADTSQVCIKFNIFHDLISNVFMSQTTSGQNAKKMNMCKNVVILDFECLLKKYAFFPSSSYCGFKFIHWKRSFYFQIVL